LVIYKDYTEMHGQQNIKISYILSVTHKRNIEAHSDVCPALIIRHLICTTLCLHRQPFLRPLWLCRISRIYHV